MRCLVSDSASIRPGLYRRLVRRAQIHGFLADHLVAGEPYLAPNAVVLAADEDALLRRLTVIFASAFDRAGREVVGDVAALQEMGFPWVASELMSTETPRCPLIGRFDFARDRNGHWWLLEYNADTPSGVREAIVVDHLAHELLPGAQNLERPSEGLSNAIVQAFLRAMGGVPAGRALGIITDAGELEDLCQMAFTRELLCEPLRARGVPVVLGDVDNLRATRDGLKLRAQPIGALYRYFPLEAMLGTPAFAAIYEAVAMGKLFLLNGLYGLLLQHKGILAWLWEHRNDSLFSNEERAAIAHHLPPTWPISGHAPDANVADVVVKQVFGREGEEVFFGEDLEPSDWADLRQRRTYVVQRRIPVAELDATVWTSDGPTVARGHIGVGSFVVDGAWAGYYSRFGSKKITARAKWLATLAEKG